MNGFGEYGGDLKVRIQCLVKYLPKESILLLRAKVF